MVSVISELGGGAGRVLADLALALRGRPQLVVCQDPWEYSGQGLRAELEAAGVPVRVVPDDGALRELLARYRPAAVVHHWTGDGSVPRRAAGERWLCLAHTALPLPPGYDAYVVPSAYAHRFQRHLPRGRVHRIPHGVDWRRFAPRRRGARAAGAPVTVAMLSRLAEGKFPRRLLDYLAPLADLDLRVRVAGFGARRHEIEPELAERGLGRMVRFVGPLPAARVPAFLGAADVGLHLTETSAESFGLAVLEMMAAGLPVVAEPKGALPELVADGAHGFLARDDGEVAARLRQLVTAPAQRGRMGRAARRAARGFGMPRFRSAWRALLREVTR